MAASPRIWWLAFLALPWACTGGQTGDEDTLGEPNGDGALVEIGRMSPAPNYEPARSIADLVARSERVVVAKAEMLAQGRSFLSAPGGAETRIETVVMRLGVLRTLKGDDDAQLHLEFLVGDAEAVVSARLPEERLLVFAAPASGENIFVGGSVEGAGSGLPAGAPLFRLTTPQGMILDSTSGASSAFEPGDVLVADRDFDDIVDQVALAVAGGVAAAGSGGGASGGAGGDAGVLGSDAMPVPDAGAGEPVPDAGAADADGGPTDADAGVSMLPVCEQPFEVGMCRASFPVFAFDPALGACTEKIYGGCGGNDNRFDTQAQCEAACGTGKDAGTGECAGGEVMADVCLQCGPAGGCSQSQRTCVRTCATNADCAGAALSTQCWGGFCQQGGCI